MMLNELFEAAKILDAFYTHGSGWYSGEVQSYGENRPGFNHWSGALAELKESLGRRLTDAEMCVLSLSLSYGPTPGIDEIWATRYGTLLYPQGNHCGVSWPPMELVGKLAWADRDDDLLRKVFREEEYVSSATKTPRDWSSFLEETASNQSRVW